MTSREDLEAIAERTVELRKDRGERFKPGAAEAMADAAERRMRTAAEHDADVREAGLSAMEKTLVAHRL